MVAVNIAGSDPLNGFDVSIATDPTVLAAADADLTGSVVTSATVLLKCLDGVLVTGSVCASQDGPGVLHFSAVKTGALVAGSGLLFTAVYNVVASTPSIPMNFAVDATDCSSTSVGGGVCVSISNGSTTLNSEMVTGASFSNLSDFAVDCSPASIETPPSIDGTCLLTLHSFGGFTDFVDLTVFPDFGLTAFTADVTLLLPPDGSVSTTLHASSAGVGLYNAIVSASADMILQPAAVTHSVTVPVNVAFPDFTIAASPGTLNIPPGSFDTSTITIGSISGFSGSVALTAVSVLGTSLFPVSVTAPGTSTLTVTVAGGTPSGVYTVTVTGTSGSSHSVVVTVNVGEPDFSLAATPDALVIPKVDPVRTGASSLNVASLNNFAAMLTITVSVSGPFAQVPAPATEIPGAAITTSLSTSTIVLSSGGTGSSTLVASALKASTGTGLHVVTVTVSGGSKTHTVVLDVWVIDFTMTLQDPVVTLINDPVGSLQHPVQTMMTVRILGAPNQTVTAGLDMVMAVPLLNAAYTFSPSTGRIFDQLPLTDTARNRCFMAVYDSGNMLITPTLAGTHVASFLAPLVHINGDSDGDPPDFNGCRFDSGSGPSFFGTGPTPGVNTGDPLIDDFPMATVEILPGTPNGMYTAQVCMNGGIIRNCVPWTINLVGTGGPAINQFGVKDHKMSLALDTIQTFTVGVKNPAGNPTLYVKIIVVATDGNGNTVQEESSVVTALAGVNTNNILVNMDVSSLSGVVHYSASVQYGVDPGLLQNIVLNQGNQGKSTGSFLVTP